MLGFETILYRRTGYARVVLYGYLIEHFLKFIQLLSFSLQFHTVPHTTLCDLWKYWLTIRIGFVCGISSCDYIQVRYSKISTSSKVPWCKYVIKQLNNLQNCEFSKTQMEEETKLARRAGQWPTFDKILLVSFNHLFLSCIIFLKCFLFLFCFSSCVLGNKHYYLFLY